MRVPPRSRRAWRAAQRALLAVVVCAALAPACGRHEAAQAPAAAASFRPTVLLISFDGWRWDYDRLTDTPHLDRLMRDGSRAERLIPVFPSKTFPSHYSLVTGLYPETHGVISNNMYDAQLGRFSLGNREAVGDGRWWDGEPLWVTAERQGQASATLFWPGSEAPIQGIRPSYWQPYDGSMPNASRIDQALAWLDLPPADRPTFITLYFSDTDAAGHRGGPASPAVIDAIRRLDAALGRLLDGLEARGLLGAVNVVVTSDHGMAEISPDRVIVLDDYIDLSRVDVIDWSPVLAVHPAGGASASEVYDALAGAHPRLRIYRREALPERLRYRNHRRVPPVIGLADEGWTIMRRSRLNELRARFNRGDHGYDPARPAMHGIFVAAGPAFRSGVVVPPVENIHVYELMASVLGLTPAPNDGDPGLLRPLLVPAEALAAGQRLP